MSACPIPTPPGYTPCIKERGHAGLHDFVRLPDPRWRCPHDPTGTSPYACACEDG